MTNQNPTHSRVPPQNLEAEQSVLGSILLDNEALYQVAEILQEKDFYREAHRMIFSSIMSLMDRDEPADLVTLTNELKQKGDLAQVGGVTYLAQVVDAVPTAANVEYYAKIVREKAILRDVIHASTEIITSAYQESNDIVEFLDKAEQVIFQVSESREKAGLVPISNVLKTSFKQIEQNYERKELITGLATGFKDLDKLTAGLQPSDLIIVAGRPAMGKTSFVLNIAEHVALKEKESVAIFSLEMAREQLASRLLCSMAKIDSSRLRSGFIDEVEWMRLTDAAGMLSDSKIFIDDMGQANVFEMRAKARRLKSSKGLGLVIIDYLQLMRGPGKAESREREISEISRSLKAMAKELNVPVIALSQL
ncbi:MAG: replicative DNA helicase, partial [Proteobacteria bacterium]|nr:replicative DNA helicase [Pseudomonadota bacterium]